MPLNFKSPAFVGSLTPPPVPIQISILGGVGGGGVNFNLNQVGLNSFANSFYTTSNGLIVGKSVIRIKTGTGSGSYQWAVINSSSGVILARTSGGGANAFRTLDVPILITGGMSLNICVIGSSTARPNSFVSAGGSTSMQKDTGNGPYPTITSPVVGDFTLCTGCSIGWEIEMI